MVEFVEKNDQKPPAPETNAASSSSSNSPPGVAADVDNSSQPLRVKITLQGREIVVSSDDKPPLGLRLEKTQPFLDKIAAAMEAAAPATTTGTATATQATAHHNVNSVVRQRLTEAQPPPYQLQFQPLPQYHHYHQQQPPMPDKLKASNFAAMFIKIGSWQRTAMNEGELVAKFYYAKKKIVWEVLDGALKSKMEMLWSDIEGIKATIFHDDVHAPGVLELELNQPPQFFQEDNPQPRTHATWKESEDFTGGQAPMCRRHLIKFPGGILNKPYEKLLRCDPRLLELSWRAFPRMESPYFYPQSAFNITTSNDDIPFNSGSTGETHFSYSRRLQHYFSPLPPTAPPPSFLVSHPHQLVQNPVHVHSLLGSNPPRLPLSDNFQAPPGVAAGFPPLLSDGQMAAAYENIVNDNRHWHQGTPSIAENSNIFYSRGQEYQIQRLPPFPNPSAATLQAFPGSQTAATNYGVADPNTVNTLDDIRRLLQWDSRSLSLNQRPRPMMSSSMEPLTAEINAPGNSGLDAQLQWQQQYKPHELFHGENFRVDGGLPCPQPLHSFPSHIFDDENAVMSPPDDNDTDYALSYGGHGTQP